MVFAANQIFVGEKSGYGKFVVPSRMVYPSRQREVPFYADWCRQRDYRVIELEYGTDYLEGHGDLLWHPDGCRIYGGYGFRSTRGGVEKFAAAMSEMGIPVVALHLIDPYCYHLDTCLCPLNNEAALLFPGAYSAEALASLHKFWKRVHLLTAEEAHRFMGNGIVVNGSYITPHITPQLETILRAGGADASDRRDLRVRKGGRQLLLHEDFLAVDRVSLTQKQMKKNLDRDSGLSRVARFPQLRMLAWSGDYL